MSAPDLTLQHAVVRTLGQTPGEPHRAALVIQSHAKRGDAAAGAALAHAWADFLDRFAEIVAGAASADADAALAGIVGAYRRAAAGAPGAAAMIGRWRDACVAAAAVVAAHGASVGASADAAAAGYVLRAAGTTVTDAVTQLLYRADGPRAPAMQNADARAFQWRLITRALGGPCSPMPRFIAPHRLAASALGEAVDVPHLERRVAAEQRAIRRGWKEYRS